MVKHNNTLAKAGNFRKNWQVRIESGDGGIRAGLAYMGDEEGKMAGIRRGRKQEWEYADQLSVVSSQPQQLNSFALPTGTGQDLVRPARPKAQEKGRPTDQGLDLGCPTPSAPPTRRPSPHDPIQHQGQARSRFHPLRDQASRYRPKGRQGSGYRC